MTAEGNLDRKILIVEDEPDLRELLTYNFSAAGFKVQATENGTDGLAAVEKFAPDVVLLDLMLPDIPGTEVCRRIRGGEVGSRQPAVMMLTAKGEEIDRVVGFELGADDYVVKPFSVREVVLRVGAIIRTRLPPRPGATVVDVGVNKIEDRAVVERLFPAGSKRRDTFERRGSILVGDVHPEVENVAGALTPVPGGVGPLTIAMLLKNTLRAAQLRAG